MFTQMRVHQASVIAEGALPIFVLINLLHQMFQLIIFVVAVVRPSIVYVTSDTEEPLAVWPQSLLLAVCGRSSILCLLSGLKPLGC